MVTREMLEDWRSCRDEIRELRARMRTAELAAMESERESDRDRASTAAAIYEATAECRETEMLHMEAEIDALPSAGMRRVLRMRYGEGRSLEEIAQTMHYSVRTIQRIEREAVRMLEAK